MSKLAHVLVGLDELTPTELGLVADVIALRGGKIPSSPPEKLSPSRSGFFRTRRSSSDSKNPGATCEPTYQVDPQKWELVESHEFTELIRAITLCSAPLLSGPGRKGDNARRVLTVKGAWEKIPTHLKRPFREVENLLEGLSLSPPETPEETGRDSAPPVEDSSYRVELPHGA